MKHHNYKSDKSRNKLIIILCLTFILNVYPQNNETAYSNDKGILTGIWQSIKDTLGIDKTEEDKISTKKLHDRKAPEICKIILANNPEKE